MLKKTGSSFLRHASYLAKAKSGPIGQSFQTIFLFPMAMQKKKKKVKEKEKKNEIITWFPLNIDVNGILNYRASYFVKRRMWKTGRQ